MGAGIDDVRSAIGDPSEALVSDASIQRSVQKWRDIVNDECSDSVSETAKHIAIVDAAAYEVFRTMPDGQRVAQLNLSRDYDTALKEFRETAESSLNRIDVTLQYTSSFIVDSTDWFGDRHG